MQTGSVLKTAAAERFEFIVTWQTPLPEHAPDQLPKPDPVFPLGFNKTVVPLGKVPLHTNALPPQIKEPGYDMILPPPPPPFDTDSIKFEPPVPPALSGGADVNAACNERAP